MHFEILVEDQSGMKMLEILMSKIVGNEDSYKIHPYKGIGHIPKNLNARINPKTQVLLNKLPKLLKAYGRTFAKYPDDYQAAVIVVCDLDDRCLRSLRQELSAILDNCDPKPETRFCVAIEEGEAWLLGDIPAIKKAYPKARDSILKSYDNDSICGTWELLADAINPGGLRALSKKGKQETGKAKSVWAERITPHMGLENNKSESFHYFLEKIKELIAEKQ